MANTVIACLFALVGILALSGSLLNANWLMKSEQVAFFIRFLGQTGTRIFYSAVGLLSIFAGITLLLHSNG